MDILSALKNEASKLQQQLDTLTSAMKILGAKNSVGRVKRGEKRAHVCKCESQNSEGAKGAVGEGESCEEECLKA